MKVYVYPADLYGCGSYRLAWPAAAVAALGDIEVVIAPPNARDGGIGGQMDDRTGRMVDVSIPDDADVIVMQRVSLANLVEAVPMIRRKGVAVVIDMDDDLTKIDPSNPAFVGLHPKTGRDPRHNWGNPGRACAAATMVTTSTPQLQAVYAQHGRGAVLENCIPARYLDVVHHDSGTLGWPGSTHSHPLDLQEVGPSLARLMRAGFEYQGVGPRDGLKVALGLDEEPEVTGSVDLEHWPQALASIGVGLAPLADTLFNQAKSWLKVLELSAAGVPWVASPRAEYRRFSDLHHGLGYFAERSKDWFRQMKRLASDELERTHQSQWGRAAAAEHTIEGNAWRWAEVWYDAMKAQRRQGSALSRAQVIA